MNARLSHKPTERMTIKLWPDAAHMLGVSRTTIYKAAKLGQVPTVKVGNLLLVPKPALERLLNAEPQLPEPQEGR
jgi:excisionase family DNA binding protein